MEDKKIFESTCSQSAFPSYSNESIPKLMQAYQDYKNILDKKSALYLINFDTLFIYSTENDSEQTIIIKTPEPQRYSTCSISQLPNGNLFCFGNYPNSWEALIIDEKGESQQLPSGPPLKFSSSIPRIKNGKLFICLFIKIDIIAVCLLIK
ncbi:unnamed protein product [Blepharisma stoltei]|uniref:Uncharacterized protein n=1 Tax=Blepharisma stoltei TaxID=1481888 RepID=A0AAU9K9R6_9CILI|nr:unnamed protein product [Blepharisma stoltei]